MDNHRGGTPVETTTRRPRKVAQGAWIWLAVFGMLASFIGVVQPATAQAVEGEDGLTVIIGQDSIVQGSGDAFTFKVKDTNKSGMVFDSYYLYGFDDGWTVYNGATQLTPVISDPAVYQISKDDAQAGKISAKPPLGFSGTLDTVTFARVEVTDEAIDPGTPDPSVSPEPSVGPEWTGDNADDGTIQSGDDGTVEASEPASEDTATPEPEPVADTPSDTPAEPQVTVTDSTGAEVEPGSLEDIVANLAASETTTSTSKWTANWWWLHCKCCCICKCCCVLKVQPCTNQLTINKISNPATGSAVNPGQVVTYTVTAKNPSLLLSLTSVTITDDLSDVLDNGQLTGTPSATISGRATTAPVVRGNTLSWSGSLGKAQSVVITYQVTVNSDVNPGNSLVNHVVGSGVNSLKKNIVSNCVTGTEPGCTSTLTVKGTSKPGLNVSKTSDPPSGSYVLPGRLVSYTLNATNTGNVTLSRVTLTDDLSDVLDNATITGGLAALVDGQAVAGVVLRGSTLTWTGVLAPGQTVEVHYWVLVNNDTTYFDTLRNRVVGDTGTSTPSNCVTGLEEGCYSLLNPPFTAPSLNVSKVSDPANGSLVSPGQVVTYTVTATNTSDSLLNPVQVTDNLSGVLNYADFDTNSLMAKIDGNPASPAAQFLGSTVAWTGPLAAGSTVIITYQAKVHANVTSADVLANAVIGQGEDPRFPGLPATSTCVTGQEPGCFSTLTGASSSLTINKVSDPASGSIVGPGQTVTYTVTAKNDGNIDLNPVVVNDSLVDILNSATLVAASLGATIDGVQAAAPQVSSGIITWQGAIPAGSTAVLTYQVIVNNDLGSVTLLTNKVTGHGVNPLVPGQQIDSNCVTGTEPGCSSTLTIGHPNLEVSKTSDPPNGSFYNSGQTIHYTLAAHNTGNVDLATVTLTDDLSGVLDKGIFVYAYFTAAVDGVTSSIEPVLSDDNVLTWEGPLAAGSTVNVTYAVTASTMVIGEVIENHLVSSATVPYNPDVVVPTTCVTGEEDGCFSILTPYLPNLKVLKTSNLPNYGTIHRDEVYTYTVNAQNAGTVDFDAVTLVDHLEDVLPNAHVTDGPYPVTIDGTQVGTATLDLDAQTLTWVGPLAVGKTAVLTFQVQVDSDVLDTDSLYNWASGTGTDSALSRSIIPSNCMARDDEGCFVVLYVSVPGTASAREDVASTTSESNDVVEGSNTAAADEQSAIRSDASFRSESVVAPVVGSVVTPALPKLVVNKVSTPGSGTASSAQTISYIVTAYNAGNVDLNRVTVSDNLSDVLDNGSIRSSSLSATMNGQAVATPVLTTGDALNWVGDIPAGQTVTMSYQVTLDQDLTTSDTLTSEVTGEAMDPVDPAQVVESNCVTGDESGCYSAVAPQVSDLRVQLTSDLAVGASVMQGDVVTYTVTGQNAGNADLYGVRLNDDLSGVLSGAQLVTGPMVGIIDGQSAGEVTVADGTLTWSGDLPAGKTVTVSYQVIVNSVDDPSFGLSNSVSGYGSTGRFAARDTTTQTDSNCPPNVDPRTLPPECQVWNGILAYYIQKESVPSASVRPDQILTYHLTINNNSSKAEGPLPDVTVEPTITDDLTTLLNDVDYVGNLTATITDHSTKVTTNPDLPTWNADTHVLTWQGTLEPWTTLAITFDVKVKTDTTAQTLTNTVVSTGVDDKYCNPKDLKKLPTGEEIDSKDTRYSASLPDANWCVTSIPVRQIGLEMGKTASPTTVAPNGTVTYTLTAHNTGTTVLNGVTLTDDMTGVLAHAVLTGTPTAKIGDTTVTAPTTNNSILTWTGDLQGGETVVVTYQVKVNGDVAKSDTLHNSLKGSGATDPSAPNVPVPMTCVTGQEAQCTTTVTPIVPSLDVKKTSTPADGSLVAPGDSVNYTLTATNTGNTTLNPVVLTDDLSDMLDNGTLVQSSLSAKVNNTAVTAPTVADGKLTWSGSVPEGGVVVVQYTVTINSNLTAADTLKNAVTGTGTNPDNPTQPVPTTCATGTEANCSSTLHPNITKFAVTKTASPASFVRPGDTITYTITGVNSGNQDLTPTITDNLANVATSATFVTGSATAKVDGVTKTPPSVSGMELSWTGSVPQGTSVVITYQVKVLDTAISGAKVVNNVTTDIPGACDPGVGICSTSVTVSNTGLDVKKVSDPATGSTVKYGDVVTYTLTAHNTGESDFTNVQLNDDLSAVLAHATLNGTPTVSVTDGSTPAAPQVANGSLAWTGTLKGGATVTITYKVTIGTLTAGQLLTNKVIGSAVDTANPNEPPTSTCVTGLEPGCFSTLTPQVAGASFNTQKTSDAASVVHPGDVIHYTITSTNTGDVPGDPAVVDTLPTNATLDTASLIAKIGTQTAAAPVVAADGQSLSWHGTLQPGETVTITYQATVNATVKPGDTVTNCVVDADTSTQTCVDEHVAGLTVNKVSDPVSGTRVGAGETVSYTLTAKNEHLSQAYSVTLSDNLSAVLNNATLVTSSVTATIDNVPVAAPTVSAQNVLTWTGSVAAGKTVVVKYSVTVNSNVESGQILKNAVIGSAPDPDRTGQDVTSTCVTGTEVGCFSALPVGGTTFVTSKTADPSDVVRAGDKLTYTMTSQNTGDLPGDPDLFDDMSNVVNNAVLDTTSLKATIDGIAQDAPVLAADGKSWTWNGTVQPGKSVVVVYTVTVNTDARPGTLLENSINSVDCDPDLGPLPDRCTPPPVHVPGLDIHKTSVPASGSKVAAGQTISYTLTATNEHTSQTYDSVKLSDDLSAVLAHATLNAGPIPVMVGTQQIGTATVSAQNVLSWTGSLAAQATATIKYSVTVNDDVAIATVLKNAVTGSAPDPDNPGEDVTSTCVTGSEEGCSSTVTVTGPFFDTTKTVSPSGNVHPGDVVTYTITSKNTGDVAGTPGIDDDMTDVLDDATLTASSLTAKIGDVVQVAPVVANGHITWNGMVQPNETVVITYTVTVKADAEIGAKLDNSVTTTTGPCSETPLPPQCNPGPNPVGGLLMGKVSDPPTGSKVAGGQVVTYTLTATNTEDPTLDNALTYDPVHLTDDLSNVLNHAVLDTSSLSASIDGVAAAAPVVSAANVLTWDGKLTPGQKVTVTYKVTVNSNLVAANILKNAVTGTAKNPDNPDTDIPSTCDPNAATPDPKCSSILTPEDSTVTLNKTSVPGSLVDPGQVITYTLTGKNNGNVDATKIVTDDLTDVIQNSTYVTGSATATVGTQTMTPPAVSGASLTWTGTVPAGQTLTITYQMKVNDNALPGTTLTNGFTINNPGEPPVIPNCKTNPDLPECNTVTVAGLQVAKVSDPASNVQGQTPLLLEAGQTITYTLTAKNVSDTTYYPVVLTDRLSSYTTLVPGSLHATSDGGPVADPTVANGTMTWTGTLQAMKTVTVTYSVTVNTGLVTENTIRNAVIGSAEDASNPDRAIASTCVTGTEVGCFSVLTPATYNPPRLVQFDLAKTSTPSGTVLAGNTITYTITGTNSGNEEYTPIVTDNLSQVLNNATFVAGSATAKIGSQTVSAPTLSGTTLTWTGPVAQGTTVTITYQVKVNADVPTGTVLRNEVTSDLNPTCDPTVNPDCRHDVTVDNPGLQISKTSNPPTGSKVYSGQTVTYTLTAVNKGLDELNVTLTDDMTGVLAHATATATTFPATIDGQAVGNATVTNKVLTWTGPVAAGKTVTVVYSVVMNADLSTVTGTLKNDVSGKGTGPNGEVPSTCVTGDEPGCSSILTPEDIAFLVTKVSDPPSGSIVSPTQSITYTISGTNTSSGPINATLTDDLSGVLNNASLVFGSAKTTIDGQPASDPVSSANKTMTWTGTLNAGQTAVMTYTVVVNQDATVASSVKNLVKGTAKNPNNPNEDLPTSCTTGNEPGCSSTVVVGDARVQIAKASNPANGMRVDAGDTVTYTLTAQTGNLPLDPVVLTDNLSDVLDNAELVTSSVSATINGQVAAAPAISADNVLTWVGAVPANATVTVKYAVVVKADQPVTSSLYNKVIGGGTDKNNPNTPAKSNCVLGNEPGCYSNLPVGPAPAPRLDVTKVSNPVTGSVVRAGQVITYTLTGANVGNRDLNPVTLTDDLAGVAAHATLVTDSLKATIDGQAVTAPTITNNSVLTWTGPVAIGKSVVVTYQYTVNQDIAVGDILSNSVTGKATAPDVPGADVPSSCVDGETGQPGCSSTLTGGEGDLNITKTSDPADGSMALPGQTITYTLTASNKGNAPIDDVSMTDNLSGVLNSATLVPGSLTVNSAGTAEAPAVMGSSIVWEGSLDAGQTVTVTYQVVVNTTVTVTDKIVNKVVGVGTNPDTNPKNPDKKTPSTCVTGDEPGCSSTIIPEISKLDIKKAANVPSATSGQTITYTVTAVNAGTVDLNPVNLSDNLTDVLKYGTVVNGSLKATISGAAATAPVLSNSVLTWTGAVPAGKTVVLTYQVTVNSNVTTTATVYNHVTGSGVNPKNPGGPNPSTCVTGNEPGCSVPVIVGPTKISTGGTASHGWTPMETLPLMGVLSGLLLAYFSTRRPVTIKK